MSPQPHAATMVRQCAWCRRVADPNGDYRRRASRLIPHATHGCCGSCESRLLRKVTALRPAV